MLGSCAWLALEVKYLDEVAAFYRDHLDLTVLEGDREDRIALDAGRTRLVLRRPDALPRGGLHTHYAFSIPSGEYDQWYDRLAPDLELWEATFGSARSLYCYDPAGNCVDLGETGIEGPGIDGIFEIVLEVESVERARAFYTDLGFSVVDEGGGDRPRVRLSTGALDLELWEPHLGIADGRGGVHVDWGLRADEPAAVAGRVRDQAREVVTVEKGTRVRDPDGHFLTLVAP